MYGASAPQLAAHFWEQRARAFPAAPQRRCGHKGQHTADKDCPCCLTQWTCKSSPSPVACSFLWTFQNKATDSQTAGCCPPGGRYVCVNTHTYVCPYGGV